MFNDLIFFLESNGGYWLDYFNANGVLLSFFINLGDSGTICFINSIDGGGEHNVMNNIDDKIISTIFMFIMVLNI